MAADHKTANLIIDALEALGLLKYDDEEPEPKPELDAFLLRCGKNDSECVLVSRKNVFAAVASAGYKVERA